MQNISDNDLSSVIKDAYSGQNRSMDEHFTDSVMNSVKRKRCKTVPLFMGVGYKMALAVTGIMFMLQVDNYSPWLLMSFLYYFVFHTLLYFFTLLPHGKELFCGKEIKLNGC